MKQILVLILTLVFISLSAAPAVAAAVAPAPEAAAAPAPESRRQEKLQQLLDKKMDKLEQKASKKPMELDRYLKLAIIFFIAAVIFSVVSVFVPFIWILSSLAGLAATIFFILWLVELVGAM
ncbi:MAG: hypothetical protein NW241_06560 [Bacteroidia bacterium]|nr:hypothetical protein [Bacteroidia bacterium]